MGDLCESDRNKTGISNYPYGYDEYDVIVSINSIKDICKEGWNIKYSENFKKDFKNLINYKTLKIGIIGNQNKGKTFILNKLFKMNLPAGTNIKTEGLSIKYPDLEKFKYRRITLLDSAGFETPVLKDETEVEGEDESRIFKEKSKEKIITELFLQNYIIHNSDFLLVVVGILTYSEQKLLNKIRLKFKKGLLNKQNKTLCIIHNLMAFTTVDQVESYKNDTLLKNTAFNLEKNMKINIKEESRTGVCYYEKNSDIRISHLIFANEGSEAGKYYNDYTLSFIENLFATYINLKEFDILETIKERFKEFSKDVFENLQGEIEFDNSTRNLIKLKNPKELYLKRFFIDESGFHNMNENGFEPKYNYYITNNQIVVIVEVPGESKISSSILFVGEYAIIRILGIKGKDEKLVNIENSIINVREFGPFSLNIPIKLNDFLIKNEKPKIEVRNGIFILTYQIEKSKKKYIYQLEYN